MKVGLALLLTLVVASAVFAQVPAVDYSRDIKPILKERCFACHGALQQKAGLRLDTGAMMRRGGDGGPAENTGHFTDVRKSIFSYDGTISSLKTAQRNYRQQTLARCFF